MGCGAVAIKINAHIIAECSGMQKQVKVVESRESRVERQKRTLDSRLLSLDLLKTPYGRKIFRPYLHSREIRAKNE